MHEFPVTADLSAAGRLIFCLFITFMCEIESEINSQVCNSIQLFWSRGGSTHPKLLLRALPSVPVGAPPTNLHHLYRQFLDPTLRF